ncbi:MAG: Lrp/AsnC family transcriptional regulator [Candidatus Micrarchaeia archaeon]
MSTSTERKDMAILQLLIDDSSLTKKQIAKTLGIPLTTVHNRISHLEKDGIIEGYRAKPNWKKLGFGIAAFINITINYSSKGYSQEDTARKISQLDGVDSVSIVAGTYDIVAKVRKKDTDELNTFIINNLRKIPGIDKTTTVVILKEYEMEKLRKASID